MNKEQIISAIAEKTGKTKKDSQEFVEALIDTLTEALSDESSEDSIQISPFGIFSVKIRKATTGRNPRTGEPIDIPEKRVVKFTPAKKLKDLVNGDKS